MKTDTAMTFEQFQAVGRDVDNVGETLGDASEELGCSGRVYDNAYWVLRRADGSWYTRVIHDEVESARLEGCERLIYDWYLANL